jgi:hypothetical protein
MTRKYTKSGNPRKPRKAHTYHRPTLASILIHLDVGESALLQVEDNTQRTMATVQSTLTKVPLLQERKFESRRYFLVAEAEVTRPVVMVTRVKPTKEGQG